MAGHSTGQCVARAGLSEMGVVWAWGRDNGRGLHHIPCSSFPTEALALYQRPPSPWRPLQKLLSPMASGSIFGALGLLEVSAFSCSEISLICFCSPPGAHRRSTSSSLWQPSGDLRTRNRALRGVSSLSPLLSGLPLHPACRPFFPEHMGVESPHGRELGHCLALVEGPHSQRR